MDTIKPVEVRTDIHEAAAFQWKRVLTWGFMLEAALLLVAVLSALSLFYWKMYGATVNEAVVNAHTVRWVVYLVVGSVLCWRFAAGVKSRTLLHLMLLFVWVQLVDAALFYFAFNVPATELIDVGSLVRRLVSAMAGYGLCVVGAIRQNESRRASRSAIGS